MNIERIVLNVLDALPSDRMLSAEALAGVMPAGVDATAADLRGTLRTLEGKRQVTGVTTEDGVLWKITANGKARLNS